MTRHFLTTVSTHVDVDVFADDISDHDLKELCYERGILIPDDEMQQLFMALKLGRDSDALQIARNLAEDFTGMILP